MLNLGIEFEGPEFITNNAYSILYAIYLLYS